LASVQKTTILNNADLILEIFQSLGYSHGVANESWLLVKKIRCYQPTKELNMKEIIQSITEFFDRSMYDCHMNQMLTFDGFEIVTSEQTIVVAIDNISQCCEDVGYFMTNDDIDEFIGAQLQDIDYVDGELAVHTVSTQHLVKYQDGHENEFSTNTHYVDIKREREINDANNYAMFVNFHTSKGKLQFVAYNAGNGYYGHQFHLVSVQKSHFTSV
jgi:hypothetical protein